MARFTSSPAIDTAQSLRGTGGWFAGGRHGRKPALFDEETADPAPTWREYAEVLSALAVVTLLGWFSPVTYHAMGHVYLLTVILLCLRVGRWPTLFAAIVSALVWDYVFIPPRLSFSLIDFDDGMLLGIYFAVALIAGQLTSQVRSQHRQERLREQRATALFHLTRALSGARTLDEAASLALRQADQLFNASTALLLFDENGGLTVHPASSFVLGEQESAVAGQAAVHGRETGRFSEVLSSAMGWHLPLVRAGSQLGVFSVCLPRGIEKITSMQRDLVEVFAAQIALLVEREQLRAASEREKIVAESDRLHRTLLDSVSHELKTPLSVLRSASQKLDTDDAAKRAQLTEEILTATGRLDRLVANLLNQTRLEAGALRPQLDWCDARDLINTARHAVGDALADHPLKMDIPDDMPLLMTDAPLMEQVIVNLLFNAVLHTPPGCEIHVSGGIEMREHERWVYLKFSDSGPGLPAEMRDHLFHKFYRGQSARAGGLGLGLSIVRGFMLAQGGKVTAGDNPRGGACFTLYLPYSSPGNVPNDER